MVATAIILLPAAISNSTVDLMICCYCRPSTEDGELLVDHGLYCILLSLRNEILEEGPRTLSACLQSSRLNQRNDSHPRRKWASTTMHRVIAVSLCSYLKLLQTLPEVRMDDLKRLGFRLERSPKLLSASVQNYG